jgi:hypothetical protein
MKNASKQLIATMFVFAIATMFIISCSKDLGSKDQPDTKTYVKTIAGTFNVEDGDIQILKDAPLGVTRTWTMQARNSTYYGNVPFANVTGLEFVTGSAVYNWWHTPANNPVTYPASQAVYSNLTPDEDLRLIAETKTSSGAVSFLAMLDFNPSAANFPLTLHGFRLGDELSINTYGLTKLSGGDKITITVSYGLAPIDLAATKSKVTLTGSAGVPNGIEFTWADIVYGASVTSSVTVPSSSNNNFVTLYNGLDKKVTGNITITVTEAGGTAITKTVAAKGAGRGLKITLSTTKVGWFDSGTIKFCENDINVDSENVSY